VLVDELASLRIFRLDKKFKGIEFDIYSQIYFTVPLHTKVIVVDEVSLPEPELLAHLLSNLSSSLFLSVCDLSLLCGLYEFWGGQEIESAKTVSRKSSGRPICGSFSSGVIQKCTWCWAASRAPRGGWGA
jgi:hypothetical protein